MDDMASELFLIHSDIILDKCGRLYFGNFVC